MNVNHDPSLRVKHPKVTGGKWKSAYDKPPEPLASPWRPASELDIQYMIKGGRFEPKFAPYTEMIGDMFSRLVDFELEAWRERQQEGSSDVNLRMFDLVYESKGSSPQKVPFWGPSKIDLEKVFTKNPLGQERHLRGHHYGRDPWMTNTRKDRHYTNVWIGQETPAPFPQGMKAELRELVHIFGYPFYLYEPGKWDKPAGTDPYRMHLQVGVGDYLPRPALLRTMALLLSQGVIDARDIREWSRDSK